MFFFSWMFYILLALISAFLVKQCFISNTTIVILTSSEKKSIVYPSLLLLYLVLLFFAVTRKIGQGIGGTDAYEYLLILDNSTTSFSSYLNTVDLENLLSIREPLFVIFNIFCNKFSNSHIVYLLIIYGLIVLSFILFIQKTYSRELNFLPIILLIPCFLCSFNVIRTCWSASLCIISFCYMLDEKYIKALFFIIIASLIHYMSLCFLGVWICCLIFDTVPSFFNRRRMFIIVIAANVMTYLFEMVLINFINGTKYSTYLELIGSTSVIGHVPSLLICCYSIWIFNKQKDSNKIVSKCILALFVYLSLSYAIIFLMAWRISNYFDLVNMFMLSFFFYSFKENPNEKIYRCVLYIFTIVIFFQEMNSLKESSGVFPYLPSFFD